MKYVTCSVLDHISPIVSFQYPCMLSTFLVKIIREKEELAKKWIFVRIFRDKRGKNGFEGKDERF